MISKECENIKDELYLPNASSQGSSALRPNSLNLPIGVESRTQAPTPIPTPSLGDINPILLTPEFERILQHLKASPQTPGSFLNPKFVSEEQEKFANVFTQKLNEFKDQACFATLATNSGHPNVIMNPTNQMASSASELGPQQFIDISNLAGIIQKSVQQSQEQYTQHSFILLSPTGVDPRSLSGHSASQTFFNQLATDNSVNTLVLGTQGSSVTGSLALAIPQQATFKQDNNTLQMPVSFSISMPTQGQAQTVPTAQTFIPLKSTNRSNADAALGNISNSPSMSASVRPCSEASDPSTHLFSDCGQTSEPASLDVNTRISSDVFDSRRPIRCSSASSESSSSHPLTESSKLDSSRLSDLSSNSRIDPNEQSKLRLERKRARNRDAARKCRERKIRLIRTLEKDVAQLTEENKRLKNKLTQSRNEVERLKLFVINHLEKGCPIVIS
ncbi:unnamed protein product [Protopolystoma xenopodis]|uniref:BZIP domain-containing protein n=1 Tax=Protopolystoma xenopodis TaxID=117903 RepID=A0A3S5CLY4_9PLAT|nr:unnamed protein product [Protopolystoma xenopodis]